MLFKVLASAWTCTVLFLSLYPFKTHPDEIQFWEHSDKLVHIGMHGLNAFFWLLATKPKIRSKKVVSVLLILIVYGIILEAFQEWMGLGRSFDLRDILANILGVMLGLTSYFVFENFKTTAVQRN